MTDPIKEFPMWRYRKGQVAAARDRVAVEEPLEIRLSGEPFQVLMRLPGWEKELALGFLFTEGIVRDLAEVITMHFCGTATDPMLPPNVVDVNLTEAALARRGRRHLEVAYSSCGLCAKEAVSEICRKVPPVASRLTVPAAALLTLMARLQEAQTIYQDTGGTHAVALASPDGQVFIYAEDVGRHNAMDKVIGRAVLTRQDLTGLVALLKRPHQLRDGPEDRPGRHPHPGRGLRPHLHGPGTGPGTQPHHRGLRPGSAGSISTPIPSGWRRIEGRGFGFWVLFKEVPKQSLGQKYPFPNRSLGTRKYLHRP